MSAANFPLSCSPSPHPYRSLAVLVMRFIASFSAAMCRCSIPSRRISDSLLTSDTGSPNPLPFGPSSLIGRSNIPTPAAEDPIPVDIPSDAVAVAGRCDVRLAAKCATPYGVPECPGSLRRSVKNRRVRVTLFSTGCRRSCCMPASAGLTSAAPTCGEEWLPKRMKAGRGDVRAVADSARALGNAGGGGIARDSVLCPALLVRPPWALLVRPPYVLLARPP